MLNFTRKPAAAGLFAAILGLGLAMATPAGAAVPDNAAVPTTDTAPAAAQSPAKYAPKGMPGLAPSRNLALSYLYGGVRQNAATDGVAATFTVARPELATGDFHTLAELAAQSADGRQIVEVGWTVDRAVNNGSTNPHLFVFHWVNGNPTCYNTCGFVLNGNPAIRPGSALPVNTQQTLRILFFQGNWWIGYNSTWIGHFPGTNWGGGFTRTGLVQLFGEVAANSFSPCTDMGNGNPAANAAAARIAAITYTNGPAVSLGLIQTHPALYTAVTAGANGARHGGPGTGVCPAR